MQIHFVLVYFLLYDNKVNISWIELALLHIDTKTFLNFKIKAVLSYEQFKLKSPFGLTLCTDVSFGHGSLTSLGLGWQWTLDLITLISWFFVHVTGGK